MNLSLLLDMVVGGLGDRPVLGTHTDHLTAEQLDARSTRGAEIVRERGVDTLAYLADNGPAFAVGLFSAAKAGVPFLPLNFRLADEQLSEIVARRPNSLMITDAPERVTSEHLLSTAEWASEVSTPSTGMEPLDVDPSEIAVLLMTSGTTAAPKSAILRHQHLTSYVLGSVEYASADESDATLVSIPPYHIAAVANVLSNLYAGRRLVYLDRFDAAQWVDTVARENITNAMVVPTMLARIVKELRDRGTSGPSCLRSLSYGGAKVSASVLAEALDLFPETGFVNGYGLTETASSIAVLGPDDHREAVASDDPAIRARLGSVGRPLPSVTIEVHDAQGNPCPPGVEGDIVVSGDQIAGEYVEKGSLLTDTGWFHTRDLGHMDEGGFLFVHGRSDDTIIRGGENISPAEIEDVLVEHPAVDEVAVAGVPDEEWGHRIAAFVVAVSGTACDADELREWSRARLRSSKTPDQIMFVDELPTNTTGKLLRRELIALASANDPV